MESKQIAQASIIGTLYLVLGMFFYPISFGAVQVRVSASLTPLIAVLGWPALVGLTIGGFIYNYTSPLGMIDLLTVVLCIPPRILMLKYGLKATILNVLVVSLWVPYMLTNAYGLPFWPLVISVGVGEVISELLLGIPLALAVKNRLKI